MSRGGLFRAFYILFFPSASSRPTRLTASMSPYRPRGVPSPVSGAAGIGLTVAAGLAVVTGVSVGVGSGVAVGDVSGLTVGLGVTPGEGG